MVDGTLKPSPPLADAWRTLAARWTDAAEHVRFLRLAAAGGELAAAGHLYRIRLARAPGDAVARQSLEAAVKLASAPVSVAALRQDTAAAPSSRRAKAVAMAAVLLLAPTLMFVLLRLSGAALTTSVESLLGPRGRLSQVLPGWEHRPEQLALAREVERAFARGACWWPRRALAPARRWPTSSRRPSADAKSSSPPPPRRCRTNSSTRTCPWCSTGSAWTSAPRW